MNSLALVRCYWSRGPHLSCCGPHLWFVWVSTCIVVVDSHLWWLVRQIVVWSLAPSLSFSLFLSLSFPSFLSLSLPPSLSLSFPPSPSRALPLLFSPHLVCTISLPLTRTSPPPPSRARSSSFPPRTRALPDRRSPLSPSVSSFLHSLLLHFPSRPLLPLPPPLVVAMVVR